MYHTYTTEAVVLESAPTGDISRLLWLFTKDFGLILADVKSARGHLSKLRPSIQTYSYGLFTLIRGRYGWKVVNVIGYGNHYYDVRHNNELIPILARATYTMRRLIGLEDVHREVFTLFQEGMQSLVKESGLSLSVIESVMMCRILNVLGFLHGEDLPLSVVDPTFDFSEPLISSVLPLRRRMNEQINISLKHSGLM